MNQRSLNPADWPVRQGPRRTPPVVDRLRQLRADAKHFGYGPNDRQALMLNPEEIDQLLARLEPTPEGGTR
jgi:hypothetical protein